MHCGREKSAESETEQAAVTAQLSELDQPATLFVATGERILELDKKAIRPVRPRERNRRMAG